MRRFVSFPIVSPHCISNEQTYVTRRYLMPSKCRCRIKGPLSVGGALGGGSLGGGPPAGSLLGGGRGASKTLGGPRACTGSSKTSLGRRRGSIFIKESLVGPESQIKKSGSNFVSEYQAKLFPSSACSRAFW